MIKILRQIIWTEIKGAQLSLDIYVPEKTPAPVLMIFHGGGWLINSNRIMDDMSRYMAEQGGMLVVNVNYRLLADNNNGVALNEIVEDAFGAVLWVKNRIADFGGDARRIAITGDSAGAHLAAMVLVAGRRLGAGFSRSVRDKQNLSYCPSFMPESQTFESLIQSDALRVQAAVLSYGIFDLLPLAGGLESIHNTFWQLAGVQPRPLLGAGITVASHPEWYKAVSPAWQIPPVTDYRLPPQFHHVGSLDDVTPSAGIQQYVAQLRGVGQTVEFREYAGKRHAYLDSGKNDELGRSFQQDAIPVLEEILGFLDAVM